MAPEPRLRRSIQALQQDYDKGKKKPLEDLWRAWIGIQRLPHDDPNSLFTLAGYHGMPGNYCNHGNVLFPTWHRAYMLKVEDALRSIDGCESVTLPYWDETDTDSLTDGIPAVFTRDSVSLDGNTIPNPLRSYTLPVNLQDVAIDGADYSKAAGYQTVRYPLSGLVGTEEDRLKTAEHNQLFADNARNISLLNQNIVTWLKWTVIDDGEPTAAGQVADRFKRCLGAPNYTVFSNTTSAGQWNTNNPPERVISLESPHNAMHLAVGGFDLPGFDASPIAGANGDMGENDTAAFDPIFYFHHCFIDYVFWLWQKQNSFTDRLDIIGGFPGTSSSDDVSPPGTPDNTALTLQTPLKPFVIDDNGNSRPMTSADCVNIETQLGIRYEPGSLEEDARDAAFEDQAGPPAKVLAVSEINRSAIRGSFLISVFGNVGGRRVRLGTEAVLSRWDVAGCSNCQTHLEAKASFEVPTAGTGVMVAATAADIDDRATYDVEIRTRQGDITQRPTGIADAATPLYRLDLY